MGSDRWLIVGLGNPGPGYAHNRHNVGYWCINRLARLHGITLKTRRLAAVGEGNIGDADVLLVKPRTYVNNSGHAVAAALKHTKVRPENVLVLYDELDLPAGRLRLKAKGGTAGHNGLRSIAAALGSTDFPRLRIGIGRPHVDGEPVWDPDVVSVWVLSDPTPQDARTLQDAVKRAAQAVELVLSEGLEAAMNRYNK
ncbi:MAG TPA: aminoacyl-tRNA hydrolase [Dehalococcoidia bacterium]|jgi:PTH1 family peptidyl-tRNA hydrolase|nr:aminoacyl-tRNA hydrolase [Dehalococcoidia bacterium]